MHKQFYFSPDVGGSLFPLVGNDVVNLDWELTDMYLLQSFRKLLYALV